MGERGGREGENGADPSVRRVRSMRGMVIGTRTRTHFRDLIGSRSLLRKKRIDDGMYRVMYTISHVRLDSVTTSILSKTAGAQEEEKKKKERRTKMMMGIFGTNLLPPPPCVSSLAHWFFSFFLSLFVETTRQGLGP